METIIVNEREWDDASANRGDNFTKLLSLEAFEYVETTNQDPRLGPVGFKGDEVFTYEHRDASAPPFRVVIRGGRQPKRTLVDMIRDSLFGYFSTAPGGARANALR